MKLLRSLRIAILFLLPLILGGCFDMSYRLILKDDYSGVFESQMEFDIEAWKNMEHDTLSYSKDSLESVIDSAYVKLIHYSKSLIGDNIVLDWHYSFKDIESLSEVHNEIQGGHITLTEENSLVTLRFSINAPDIADPEDAETAGIMFEGYSCFFDVELPDEIVEVDENGTILKDVTMATWEFPLDAWAKGQDIKAAVKFKK